MDVALTGGKRIPRSDLQNRGRALEAAILINIMKKDRSGYFPEVRLRALRRTSDGRFEDSAPCRSPGAGGQKGDILRQAE